MFQHEHQYMTASNVVEALISNTTHTSSLLYYEPARQFKKYLLQDHCGYCLK